MVLVSPRKNDVELGQRISSRPAFSPAGAFVAFFDFKGREHIDFLRTQLLEAEAKRYWARCNGDREKSTKEFSRGGASSLQLRNCCFPPSREGKELSFSLFK